jgi:hypothetical protein
MSFNWEVGMRVQVRLSLFALLLAALVLFVAPAAQAAEFPAIEKFVATNCIVETCGQEDVLGPFFEPKAKVTVKEAEEEGYTQAGGRVPYGVTDFKIATFEEGKPETSPGAYPKQIPTSLVTHLRTDVAPGLATNPFAVPQCSLAEFGTTEVAPESGAYPPPTCATNTVLGTNDVTVYAGPVGKDIPLSGKVYNLEPEAGLASEFGVALDISALEKLPPGSLFAHTLIKGNVEWGKQPNGTNQGDYHDYFEIDVSPALPLIRSRLVFEGRNGNGAFITNATSCPGHNTTTLKETDKEGTVVNKEFTTPIGLNGCDKVPFLPGFALNPATTGADEPDGITPTVSLPQDPKALESSELKEAVVKLPEGMTLNPSAAAGLTACTPAQARVHSATPGVACPASSEIGTVSLEVPTLPAGSLTGKIYLGGPESGPITSPPYTIYVDAESARYGVSVRLTGQTVPDEATGQLTTTFPSPENPEQPFTSIALQFKGGALAPIANPIGCGAGTATGSFIPFSEPGTTKNVTSGFAATGCASPVAFAPTQSTVNQSSTAGGHTSFTFNLERPAGQQFVSQVKTTLPAGLVGAIPAATQCAEPGASKGECPATSQIGSATVLAGSGPTPFQFSGPVYLTGPYNGAPFGLSINVPAVAGPFNLGAVVTRAMINIDPSTARVTVSSVLPRIVKGVPLRVRRISVAVDKQGFMLNPTNCSVLSTNSAVTGFVPGTSESTTAVLTSPFQVANCGALAFKPKFKAVTGAKTSKANGASLETTINEAAGGANIKSVLVQLPKQLPSRLTTLQKACLEATFAANPYNCPSGSFVGGARANTPLLAGKMKGPAILVSHGGQAFPDLDLLLEAEGVRVIVTGNTKIKNGITTTNFATTPDVPVTSITVNLPTGAHSALTAFGNVCATPLVMPTTITGQNGLVLKQNTRIAIKGCGVRIVGHKVVGNTAFLTVQTPAAGRISGKGGSVATVFRRFNGAKHAVSLRVPLSRGARGRGRPLRTKIRVGFVAKHGGGHSAATVTVTFR